MPGTLGGVFATGFAPHFQPNSAGARVVCRPIPERAVTSRNRLAGWREIPGGSRRGAATVGGPICAAAYSSRGALDPAVTLRAYH